MFAKIICARLEKKIKAQLDHKNIGVQVFDRIDSTNSEAKRLALALAKAEEKFQTLADADKKIPQPIILVALEQSAGRGRVGRSFVSRRGRGIYMTLLYFSDEALGDVVSVTTAAAVATATSIEEITGKPMKIKWVNDIYNEQGKVSGILVEGQATSIGYAVAVGVGINVGKADFPDEIKNIASSIGNIGKTRASLIAKVADKLLDFAENSASREYMNDYRSRFMLEGKMVNLIRADEIVGCGEVLGVDDDGGLIVSVDGKIEIIRSGEVTVRENEEK